MSTKKDETRLRLLEAARKLLLKRGFHGVGLEDIAAAAGVSRQAVYKSHFASKAELLLELVEYTHVAENLDELTLPVREARSGAAMLEETIRAIVLIETRVHELSLLLSSAALTDAGAAAAWRNRMDVKRGALNAAAKRSRDEGRLSPAWSVDHAVDVLMVLVSVDSYQQLVVEGGWSVAAMVERVWELCQRSMLVEPSASAKPSRRKSADRRTG